MKELDLQAYDLGWDYATFDINVPELASKLFCDGYRAFDHGNRRTKQKADRYVRKWLQIRFGALQRDKQFSLDITPEYIKKITPASGNCPVTNKRLTYATGKPTDWSVDRANNDRGYVCGNILIMSQFVNGAKGQKSYKEIVSLANEGAASDALTPNEWQKLAQLIEPAFGDHDDDINPIQILLGQSIALGMPVSPIASFQVALSRAYIEVWNTDKTEMMIDYLNEMQGHVCKSKQQHKAYIRLRREVMRRSRIVSSYSEIWATQKVQKCLASFLNTLNSAGLRRLVDLQESTIGSENTRIV